MSLYLLSKDEKLRLCINRQLTKPCGCATDSRQLKVLKTNMEADTHPVLLIDDEFSKRGLLFLLNNIMEQELPGPKILISSASYISCSDYRTDGAFGILKRCCTIEQLIRCVVNVAGHMAIWDHLTKAQRERLSFAQHKDDGLSSVLVGSSPHMETIREIIRKISFRFSCVHIEGETGTGKEVVANLLRQRSGCPDPYVVVNCSNIPETLADTHLFGSERGAYTDARESTPGYVGTANGGVLFLDELEDLGKPVQAKLLRLLETGNYQKVGSYRSQCSRFKLITASNIPIVQLRYSGVLRSDVFYRLDRMVIRIDPLRKRREDIPLLVDHFFSSIGESRRPDRDTMSRIMENPWPGNVRELFHELERLLVFAPQGAQELSYKEILTGSTLKHA